MAGINKVILVGNLGKDPEIQTFDNGAKKASFSLATSETFKNRDGQKVTQTEWHNIVIWRGLAEVAENYLKKGNQVYIEGKIKTRSWDGDDGKKRYITEIIADNMTMLGGRREQSEEIASAAVDDTNQTDSTPLPDDDLPF